MLINLTPLILKYVFSKTIKTLDNLLAYLTQSLISYIKKPSMFDFIKHQYQL